MATLRNKRKLATVTKKTPENTKNNHSQNTLNPGMAEEYITQVSEEIEGRVTKKLSQELSRTESRILCALSKVDEFLLTPHVRTCPIAVPGTSRNNNSENPESTGDHSLNDPCPEVVFSACHTKNLNHSEQEETHHSTYIDEYAIQSSQTLGILGMILHIKFYDDFFYSFNFWFERQKYIRNWIMFYKIIKTFWKIVRIYWWIKEICHFFMIIFRQTNIHSTAM